jgi:hypothetical protein
VAAHGAAYAVDAALVLSQNGRMVAQQDAKNVDPADVGSRSDTCESRYLRVCKLFHLCVWPHCHVARLSGTVYKPGAARMGELVAFSHPTTRPLPGCALHKEGGAPCGVDEGGPFLAWFCKVHTLGMNTESEGKRQRIVRYYAPGSDRRRE